jgi:hypothetical protein
MAYSQSPIISNTLAFISFAGPNSGYSTITVFIVSIVTVNFFVFSDDVHLPNKSSKFDPFLSKLSVNIYSPLVKEF